MQAKGETDYKNYTICKTEVGEENNMENVINMKLNDMNEEQNVKERDKITNRFNWVFKLLTGKKNINPDQFFNINLNGIHCPTILYLHPLRIKKKNRINKNWFQIWVNYTRLISSLTNTHYF